LLPKNIKILIADDEPDIVKLLKIYLGPEVHVLEAYDGVGALEMIQTEKPDVVFLDIGMPGSLNGLNVLRVLRQDPELKQIHIVIVSGRSPQDLIESDTLKADAYISKPFSRQDLADWSASYNGSRHAEVASFAA
jgi:CheY-like chemotaxis protein